MAKPEVCTVHSIPVDTIIPNKALFFCRHTRWLLGVLAAMDKILLEFFLFEKAHPSR
jgi:hypothetical protein